PADRPEQGIEESHQRDIEDRRGQGERVAQPKQRFVGLYVLQRARSKCGPGSRSEKEEEVNNSDGPRPGASEQIRDSLPHRAHSSRGADAARSVQRRTLTPKIKNQTHSDPSAGRIGSCNQGTRWAAKPGASMSAKL